MIKVYFDAMKSMNIGKSSSEFFEKADELGNNVLSNKTLQTTRFVRALLRGITAALRNLPTLIAVISESYNEAALNNENTTAKELKTTLDSLRNAEILYFAIGLCQILEIYSRVSLTVQYASHLPIQLWPKIDIAKSELLALSENWNWADNDLKLAAIGNPSKLINGILNTGIFKPFPSWDVFEVSFTSKSTSPTIPLISWGQTSIHFQSSYLYLIV